MQLNNAPVKQDKPLGCKYTGEVVTEESAEIRPPLLWSFCCYGRAPFYYTDKGGRAC